MVISGFLQLLYFPWSLHTRRYCFLAYLVLEKGVNYLVAILWKINSKQYCFPAYSVLEKGVSYVLGMPEKITVLTSSPIHLVTLFPRPFGLVKEC